MYFDSKTTMADEANKILRQFYDFDAEEKVALLKKQMDQDFDSDYFKTTNPVDAHMGLIVICSIIVFAVIVISGICACTYWCVEEERQDRIYELNRMKIRRQFAESI